MDGEDRLGMQIQLPIRKFTDTGYVTHGFSDGATVSAKVVESGDSGGYGIQLTVKDGNGEECCNFTMDRFAAMCMVDCLVKNILNQEELDNNGRLNPSGR